MKAIHDWDNISAAVDIEQVPVGGYVCEIIDVEERANKNGGTHLAVSFDIAEGDWRGFFADEYNRQKRTDRIWHGLYRANVPDEQHPKYNALCRFFKRFINAVEASNPGYHWDWNEASLKGKKLGILFGEREKESKRGTVYVVTEPRDVVSADDARGGRYRTPEKRLLATSGYGGGNTGGGFFSSMADEDSDLPF